MGITVRRFYFENAVANLEDRNVERAAAQIVNRDLLVFFLIQSVSERCRGRFVDNAQYFHARDLAGVFGGIALWVVEIRWHSDDGLRDFFAELRFRIGL